MCDVARTQNATRSAPHGGEVRHNPQIRVVIRSQRIKKTALVAVEWSTKVLRVVSSDRQAVVQVETVGVDRRQ